MTAKALRPRSFIALIAVLLLAACAAPSRDSAPTGRVTTGVSHQGAAPLSPADMSLRAQGFIYAASQVEPVAERICRERAPQRNCDFQIVIDDQSDIGPNAYQTLDRSGRPIVAITLPLLFMVANSDEIAFVLAHEAAHHIEGHLERRSQSVAQLGEILGSMVYSKEFELQADALGTLIAAEAGFDPLRGSALFFRIPDPAGRILSSHPANAERLDVIRRTYANYMARRS